MLDSAEVNRRLTHHLADLQRTAVRRRADVDAARKAFDDVLDREVAPTARQLVQALKSRGVNFSVQTPAGAVRLVADRSSDDRIAIELDVTRRPPAVIATRQYTRGRRLLDDEVVVAEGEAIASLDAERTLEVLLERIEPFVEK